MIHERSPGSQDGRILGGWDTSEITWTDVAGPFAKHLGFVMQAVAFDKGRVDGNIAAGGVLDEKGRIPGCVEELFQQCSVNRKWRARGSGFSAICARFHVGQAF